MDRIIAGRFHTQDQAEAVAAKIGQYVAVTDICIFYNSPPGQHAVLASGGDENHDPGTEGAGESAAGTAVAAGLAAGAIGILGGPVVALVAAGAGAYVGSLAGALDKLGNHDETANVAERRPAGVMVSVRIANPADEQRVIASLRAEGAADIEHATGEWSAGNWSDFNPVKAPRLLEKSSN